MVAYYSLARLHVIAVILERVLGHGACRDNLLERLPLELLHF